jgi:hypothetical protein
MKGSLNLCTFETDLSSGDKKKAKENFYTSVGDCNNVQKVVVVQHQ